MKYIYNFFNNFIMCWYCQKANKDYERQGRSGSVILCCQTERAAACRTYRQSCYNLFMDRLPSCCPFVLWTAFNLGSMLQILEHVEHTSVFMAVQTNNPRHYVCVVDFALVRALCVCVCVLSSNDVSFLCCWVIGFTAEPFPLTPCGFSSCLMF